MDVPLRDYIDKLLEEREARTAIRFADAQRALDGAASTLEHRLNVMNEFRQQLNQERGLYVTRDMFDSFKREFSDRVSVLERSSANNTGRFWAFGVGIALLTAVLHFAAHLWK